MTIPMCWKCCNQITEPDVTGLSFKLVGCKESKNVVDYNSAMKHCPICKVDANDESNLRSRIQ